MSTYTDLFPADPSNGAKEDWSQIMKDLPNTGFCVKKSVEMTHVFWNP